MRPCTQRFKQAVDVMTSRRKPNKPSTLPLFPEFDVQNAQPLASSPKIRAERLPTNTTTYQHPIHRWFNFIAGFSPEFVAQCCDQAGVRAGDTLLDPFAGCATAPLAAYQRGMRAVGYEPHPFFYRIGRAKLPPRNALEDLENIESILAQGLGQPQPLSLLYPGPVRFLRKLFPGDSLETLLGAREALRSAGLMENDLAFLILSRVLDKSSHSQTDGIYKAPTSRKRATSPREALAETVAMIRADLLAMNQPALDRLVQLFQSSSQEMGAVQQESVALIVTSPPYLNNFDFAEMTRMYLYFWGLASSWGQITDKVRRRLIVNTTTALNGHKSCQDKYRASICVPLHAELDILVRQLRKQRLTRAGKKEYDFLVYPYFSQMTEVLRECFRCLRPGAPIHLMVADAALYGVHISTPQFLCEILRQIGFRQATCAFVRRRGHRWILSKREGSRTGLGEYQVSAVK
jgi:DNA modification methylase